MRKTSGDVHMSHLNLTGGSVGVNCLEKMKQRSKLRVQQASAPYSKRLFNLVGAYGDNSGEVVDVSI